MQPEERTKALSRNEVEVGAKSKNEVMHYTSSQAYVCFLFFLHLILCSGFFFFFFGLLSATNERTRV